MSKLKEIRDDLRKVRAAVVDAFDNGFKGGRAISHDFNEPWEDYTEIPDNVLRDLITTLDALMETHVIVPIERIDGLKEAIIYFEHDGHDKETPYAITWDDKMSLMLKAARAHLKLQEENDE